MKTNLKRTLYAGCMLALISFGISCKNDIDNYDAPSGGIHGTIYDEETKEPIPLPAQGGAGVLVNLFEQNTNATKSVDFRAKQDGTYENTQVFNSDYKVVVNGPFVAACQDYVSINGQTQLDLSAKPFSRIALQASISADNKVTLNYSVAKTDDAFTINEVSVMWNFAPGVDVNSTNYAGRATKGTDATGNHEFDLATDNQFINNRYKIQANNNSIYVRVAAKVNNTVNYSKVIALKVN